MSNENGAPSAGGALPKPGWPEGFWEELKHDPLPDDFDASEDLPDQPDRAVGWYDEPMGDG
jgi:hypothetical protein